MRVHFGLYGSEAYQNQGITRHNMELETSQWLARLKNLFEKHNQTVDPSWAVPELSVKSLFADADVVVADGADGVDENSADEATSAGAAEPEQVIAES